MIVTRSDAAQNRTKILDAARKLFAQTPHEISMDAVAKAAGVGRATLYRNFDDLDALSSAIFEENVQSLEAAAKDSDDFGGLLLRTIDEGLDCRALIPALASHPNSPQIALLSARIIKAFSKPLKAARAKGEVRDDLKPADVLPILGMVFSTVLTAPGADVKRHAHRALSLVLDGVRKRG